MSICAVNPSFIGPSTLAVLVKALKNISNLSIIVQCAAISRAYDFLPTTYIICLSNDRGILQKTILTEQSSHTIIGLTPDTVYTITVAAANKCGTGSEYRSTISMSAVTTTSNIPVINPNVAASLVTSVCCTTTTNSILISPTKYNNLVGTVSKCSSTTYNNNQYSCVANNFILMKN